MCVCVCVCLHACVREFMCVCVCVCLHACVREFMCVCVHMYKVEVYRNMIVFSHRIYRIVIKLDVQYCLSQCPEDADDVSEPNCVCSIIIICLLYTIDYNGVSV